MLQIRDVMTRGVLTLTPEATLREAAELFARRHVSGAPVVEGAKVVGVVSATDLLDFVASNVLGTPRHDVLDAMGGDGDLPAQEMDEETSAARFAALWSDVGADTADRFEDAEAPKWDVLAEHTVGEVMTRQVCSLSPALPVSAAAEYMRSADVHRVLVLEHGRLVGIITSLDVARAVADHLLGERRYVFERPAAPLARAGIAP